MPVGRSPVGTCSNSQKGKRQLTAPPPAQRLTSELGSAPPSVQQGTSGARAGSTTSSREVSSKKEDDDEQGEDEFVSDEEQGDMTVNVERGRPRN